MLTERFRADVRLPQLDPRTGEHFTQSWQRRFDRVPNLLIRGDEGRARAAFVHAQRYLYRPHLRRVEGELCRLLVGGCQPDDLLRKLGRPTLIPDVRMHGKRRVALRGGRWMTGQRGNCPRLLVALCDRLGGRRLFGGCDGGTANFAGPSAPSAVAASAGLAAGGVVSALIGFSASMPVPTCARPAVVSLLALPTGAGAG